MGRHQSLAIWISALLIAAASAGGALAGEVKGPAGTVDNENYTGAREHSNSNCSYSGLNDLDSEDGQNQLRVQTPADAWTFYELIHGFPGLSGACHGGTNENREE